MPEQVNPANQTTPVSTSPSTKKPMNWKLIGIIAVVATLLIGGGVYAAVVLDVFGTKTDSSQSGPTNNKQLTLLKSNQRQRT